MRLIPRRKRKPGRRRGTPPLLVAAITILIPAAVTYYAFNGLPFVSHFTLYAITDNSVNVRVDSPVRIAGIGVGSVEGTTPDGDKTRITFYVNGNGRPIHSDATITIRPRLFLEGGYYLDLFPGSPSAPDLQAGATIPEANTSSPVQFFQVLSLFDANARQDLASTLNTLNQGFSQQPGQPLSSSGAAGLKNAIPQLTPTLEDLAWVAQALRGTRPGDLGRLLGSASEVTSTVARNTAALTGLVVNLNTTAGALASADGSLAESVQGVDQTLQTAPAALTAIDHALPPVANLSVVLGPSLKLAPPLLVGITEAVQELAAVVAPAERTRLLATLQATFEQLPSVLNKLGAVFPVTQALTECLRTHVTPILDSVVPDASLSSGRSVWQDFIHFLPGLADAGQNFDANGYWIRLLVGVGTNTLSLGNLPGVGSLVGDTPSSNPIQGARPVWHGDLTGDAFQPQVPCSGDPVPSLASNTAASDARVIAGGGAPSTPITMPEFKRLLDRAAKLVGRR